MKAAKGYTIEAAKIKLMLTPSEKTGVIREKGLAQLRAIAKELAEIDNQKSK